MPTPPPDGQAPGLARVEGNNSGAAYHCTISRVQTGASSRPRPGETALTGLLARTREGATRRYRDIRLRLRAQAKRLSADAPASALSLTFASLDTPV